MFDWLKRLDSQTSGIAAMMREFSQMLVDGRDMFETAANAMLGGTRPDIIRKGLFETDQRINEAEMRIRRMIVVHGTVHGTKDLPTCLVLMSLVKDAERIGDYSKNIFDLAEMIPEWDGGESAQELLSYKDRIAELLSATRRVFDAQDAAAAREHLVTADAITDACDARVVPIVRCERELPHPAGTVLAYRYFKRVAAHASNILTSLVMPVDKLDYFDEPHGPKAKDVT